MSNFANPRFPAQGALAASVLALSFAGVLVKFSQAPPVVVAFYRLFFTWLVLILIGAVQTWRRPKRLLSWFPSREDFFWSLLAGVALGVHYAAWFTSLRLTSVASSTVLVTMQPLFVVTAAYLLWREAIPVSGAVGLGLAVIGSFTVGIFDAYLSQHHLYGDALALVAAAFFAIFLLIGQGIRQRVTLTPYMILAYGSGAAVLALWAMVQSTPLYPYPKLEWLIFACLALVPTLCGHTLLNWALRFLPASTVSVSTLGEPVGASLLGFLLLGC